MLGSCTYELPYDIDRENIYKLLHKSTIETLRPPARSQDERTDLIR